MPSHNTDNNTIVSLFSGGGGLDIGFKSEGYKIIWANDNMENAVRTYKANISDNIICADINEVNIETIPKADIVIGGPPCQSFSLAGKRHTEDARGKLVWRYIDIIKHVMPKAFVFENVTGLLSAKDKSGHKILPKLIDTFKDIGYTVNYKVLNAADYGVPQRRRRVIIVGLLGGDKFIFPDPTYNEDGTNGLKKYVSTSEAIGDLIGKLEDNGSKIYSCKAKNDFQRLMRDGQSSTFDHYPPKMSELDKFIVEHVKPGGNYMDIPTTVNSKRIRRLQKDGGHTTCYGRLSPDKPSYTINTYFNRPNVGCNIHYAENRLITAREALRFQSFPDWYKIVSTSKQDRNTIIGNAVPPLLGRAIAKQLKKFL